MLPALLGSLLWHSVLTLSQQIPFEAPQQDNSTAHFVFNSLSGLLRQWPNTVHGTGHSIVPATLDAFTLLYHARQDADLPPSPEWLAWDSAMSYGIMIPRGGQTHLITYRTTRPATLLYFDGQSASWGPDGWLDSQHMFIYGMSNNGSKELC
ncbi:hypothetical protein FB45DRAFT_911822 [Roridomyces roridus]|uniref:Uncharacterized protein n=1 Tax=Roridomyces roridus TaxID=1738132 RepID=A0AAD7FMC3_9AGAR|nr:hypothetical protein FB45DRAFT_911822 [Roridomyces roridus]